MPALFLLDTNVVSEAARKRPDVGVVRFLESEPNLCVSVILFYELANGLEYAREDDRNRLTAFHDAIVRQFGPGALPVDLPTATLAGRLRGSARRRGRILHEADSLIAASALRSGATLVTRNVKDFAGLDELALLNPFFMD